MLPIAGLGIVLRRELVQLLFGNGTAPAILALTADTLAVFMLGLAAHAMIAVLARGFYAHQDTRTPVVAALVSVAVDICLSVALSGPFGLPGIALAIAIGAWVEFTILLTLLERRIPELSVRPLFLVAVRSLIATVIASGVAYALRGGLALVAGTEPGTLGLLARMAAVTGLGLATYAAVAAVLRIPELPSIVGVMADLLRRPRRA
jgi:putative peptidoglycan lipid II flippase